MATTTKVLFRGAATTTTSTTLYTVPAATTAVVTNIAATNTSASDVTFTISLNGVELQSATTIPANITAYIDLKQVMNAGDILAGGASSTSVNLHVSGVEIS